MTIIGFDISSAQSNRVYFVTVVAIRGIIEAVVDFFVGSESG